MDRLDGVFIKLELALTENIQQEVLQTKSEIVAAVFEVLEESYLTVLLKVKYK